MNIINILAEASGKDETTIYRYISMMENLEPFKSLIEYEKCLTLELEQSLIDALAQIPEICNLNKSKIKKTQLVICPNLH